MSASAPVLLAFPDGLQSANGVKIVGTLTAAKGEGVYNAIPRAENADNGSLVSAIPCAGYSELYFMPVSTDSSNPTFYIYGVYTNKQGGHGVPTQWVVKLLHTVNTTQIVGGKSAVSLGGINYVTLDVQGVAAFTAVLDKVIGCETWAQAGSSDVLATVGIPHLGGAEYLIITTSTVLGNGICNAYLWLN